LIVILTISDAVLNDQAQAKMGGAGKSAAFMDAFFDRFTLLLSENQVLIDENASLKRRIAELEAQPDPNSPVSRKKGRS
jgi:hypothetical protein